MSAHDDQVARLRQGAEAIRAEWEQPRGTAWSSVQRFHLAVADWLDAEATTQEGLPAVAELWSLAIEASGEPTSFIKIAQAEDGSPLMWSDTLGGALAVAEAYEVKVL